VETNPTDGEATAGTERETHAGVEHGQSGTGLDSNVAGALSYALGLLTGVVMFVVEPDDEFVRFHAAQSIAVFGLLFVAYVVLSVVGSVLSLFFVTAGTGGAMVGGILSLFLGLLWMVVALGALVLWIYLMVRAYQGGTPRIPVAAGIADRLV
jgi:uncharacterized membrane protein